MIIMSSPPRQEERINCQHTGLRAWRWVLTLGLLYLELSCEWRSHVGTDQETEWSPTHAYYRIEWMLNVFSRQFWKWGHDSVEYEGNWHCFHLLPLKLYWWD